MASTAQYIHFGPYLNSGVHAVIDVHTYVVGTTTDKDTWTDRDKATVSANPVASNANGDAFFYADGIYKFVVKDNGTAETLATYDNVSVLDQAANPLGEGAAISSASTTIFGTDGNMFHVTGTTGIAQFSGDQDFAWVVFDGVLTITHGAGTIIMKDGRDYTTDAGDVFLFLKENVAGTLWREASRVMAVGGVQGRKGTDTASTSAITLPTDGDYLHVTGTADIDSLSTKGAGAITILETDSTPKYVHSSSLLLPEAEDIVAKAGEVWPFVSEGSGNHRLLGGWQPHGTLFRGPFAHPLGGLTHLGTVTYSTNQSKGGVLVFNSLTINSSVVLSSTTNVLVIWCKDFFTCNGTIDANGQGGAGGAAGASGGGAGGVGGDSLKGSSGGSGGGAGSTHAGGNGGQSIHTPLVTVAGGVGGAAGAIGNNGTPITQAQIEVILSESGMPSFAVGYGGGGGGGGGVSGTAGGVGGAGGGGILIIAPKITFGASSILRAIGAAGGATGNSSGGGGGGGSGGAIIVAGRKFTDSGVTTQVTSGSGGASPGSNDGGSGAQGWVNSYEFKD